ncbi:MAG: hypothetical protein C6Y20_14045, partial [Tagaea sp. CACIAM 22H2]|nr:hypothetical protein [Tagaea sp. CACIAM 22H2]
MASRTGHTQATGESPGTTASRRDQTRLATVRDRCGRRFCFWARISGFAIVLKEENRVQGLEKTQLTLGFVPLSDCAPLVVAREKGFFEHQGLSVDLSREASWATVRDKVAVEALDG